MDFIHASGSNIHVRDGLGSIDVLDEVKSFFAFDQKFSYEGHFSSILAVQVTELADGVFIGCTVNHTVTDGTFFWNFFNTFVEVSRGVNRISRTSDYRHDSVLISPYVLKLPAGGHKGKEGEGGGKVVVLAVTLEEDENSRRQPQTWAFSKTRL
ncbi:HXXXD-type acyl-transferase family protein [Forsythia ovata]|uniref:HXXXD-type acyl-transferase family protein n=1 Tax=Forsythia ovata TaxID=205694 RepID=A0ABD1WPM1_9LAMI